MPRKGMRLTPIELDLNTADFALQKQVLVRLRTTTAGAAGARLAGLVQAVGRDANHDADIAFIPVT